MDSMDYFHERLEALEQRTEQLHQQTRTVERRLRWWRGFACGMVILGLKSWGLQSSHAVLAAQVAAMQNDIATLQAILWHLTTASNDQRAPEVGLTGAHRRIVHSASGGSNRTAPATDHGAAGAVFADNEVPAAIGTGATHLLPVSAGSAAPPWQRPGRPSLLY